MRKPSTWLWVAIALVAFGPALFGDALPDLGTGATIAVTVGLVTAGLVAAVVLSGRYSGDAVVADGRRATATVTAMRDTGTMVNNAPLIEWTLRVEDRHSTFDHTMRQITPMSKLGSVRTGSTVPVAVATKGGKNPRVAIDFDRLDRDGPTPTGGPT